MGLIQYYQITSQPVNQAICIYIIVPVDKLFVIDLSVSRYFVPKSAIIDNKIQQVIEKQFHTWCLPAQ